MFWAKDAAYVPAILGDELYRNKVEKKYTTADAKAESTMLS